MGEKTKRAAKIIIVVVLVAAIAAGGALLLRHRYNQLAEAPIYRIAPVAVHAVEIATGDIELRRDYLAIVEPHQKTMLSSRLTATVEQIYVEEADKVSAGQLLAKLDSREIRHAIESAQAGILQAMAEFAANEATVKAGQESLEYWTKEAERAEQLMATGATTRSEAEATLERLNEVRGRVESAQHKSEAMQHQIDSLTKKLAELETRLDYTRIVSPYDAVISARNVDAGDQAAPGKTLFELEDRSSLRLAFDVPQRDLPNITPGIYIQYEAGGVEEQAPITRRNRSQVKMPF